MEELIATTKKRSTDSAQLNKILESLEKSGWKFEFDENFCFAQSGYDFDEQEPLLNHEDFQ